MNSSDIPGLTFAQAREVRARAAKAFAKAEEIDAARKVLDLADDHADEIDAARGVLDLADERAEEIDTARDSAKRFTVPKGTYTTSAEMEEANERIAQAAARAADAFRSPALDAVTADIAEAIAPAFDGIRKSMVQSVRPALDSLVQPHVFGTFKPDLLGPLKLDLFGSQGLVSPVIRRPEAFTLGPEIVGHRFEGLNLGLTGPLMPDLANLGWDHT